MATSAYSTGYTVPYTGNQALRLHKELVRKEKYISQLHDHRLQSKSPLYFHSPEQIEQARSLFGVRLRPRPKEIRMYDRIHKPQIEWDQKVKRDTESNLKSFQNNARKDEDNREIPVMTNCEYGHRLNARPEPFTRDHVRIKVFHGSIYRNNGVNIGTSKSD